jgi:arylsulfatase A-like enzyme
MRGPDGPNIVLITVDTLRADHLSSYGFDGQTTPHIDALAAESALFERAVAASSSTAPSHASMLTSRYVREHSIGYRNGGTRLKGETTLAELLRDAGYATAAFVSNHVLRRELGFDRGFEHFDDRLPKPEPNRPQIFERKADATSALALEWLAGTDAPFFLWVHYQDPHGPYAPPAEFLGSAGVPVEPELEEEPIPLLSSNTEFGGVPAYQVQPGLTRPSQYRARYADEIRYVDHWIGELLAQPQLRDAIVLFTADHGESLGEAGRYFMHGTSSLPAESHVPLLLRAPGVAPRRVAEIVSHLDLLPTLLELVGLKPPAGVRGVALGPYLRGGEARLPSRIVYCDMGLQTSAYREDRIVQMRRVEVVGGQVARRGHLIVRDYHWKGTEPSPIEGGGGPAFEELRSALTSYLRFDRASMIEIENLGPEDFERLRALGYID